MITVDSNRVTYSLVYRDASHTTRNIFDLNTQLYKHLSFKHRSLELDWLTGWHIKQTAVSNLNLYWIKGALLCFSFWLHVLDSAVYSAFESTLNSSIVSYRIVSYSKSHACYRIVFDCSDTTGSDTTTQLKVKILPKRKLLHLDNL